VTASDNARLRRATEWWESREGKGVATFVPEVLVAYEKYLMEKEAEGQFA